MIETQPLLTKTYQLVVYSFLGEGVLTTWHHFWRLKIKKT